MIALLFVVLLISFTCVGSIDPFIGTGGDGYGIGSTPPGAQHPFGFCRLSPDTAESFDIVVPWRHFGGYYYGDNVIRAFTHVHMQGAGAVDLGVVGVMPLPHTLDTSKGLSYIEGEEFRQTMDKSKETSEPGLYRVELSKGKVAVELTADRLCGTHRYTFKSNNATILFLPSITIEGLYEVFG
jgi:putative alpha-1,2-mannosidase